MVMKMKDVKLTLRAWRLLFKVAPLYMTVVIASTFFNAASPYVTIYFSARLLDALYSFQSDLIVKEMVIFIAMEAVIKLLCFIFLRLRDYQDETIYYRIQKIYSDKMMALDYEDVDDQNISALYSDIIENQRVSGYGLLVACSTFEDLFKALFAIGIGIVLSVSLFTKKVVDPSFAFLDHPYMIVLITASMFTVAMLVSYFANKIQAYWADYAKNGISTFGNRYFMFFMNFANAKTAPDIRLYGQDRVLGPVFEQESAAFGPHSPVAKASKGILGFYTVASIFMSSLLSIIIYIYVALKTYAKAFAIGSMTRYIGAITKIFLGLSDLISVLGELKANAPFLEVVYTFLDIPSKKYQGSLTTEKRQDSDYEVEFKNVSFKYPNTDVYVLKNINIRFKVGSKLAIVGKNGSGKTTFIKLLCRLYDPSEGQILLNGIDIKKYRYDEYMDIFSIVFQDYRLFSFSLKENVAVNKKIDEKKVIDSLCKAGFDLDKMKDGIDTYLYKDIDEDGVMVSGGEAQKIAIARALYKDAPFVILDEPTAALDPISESEIYEHLNELIEDKTAVFISHRLSSCKFCDEIAVFDDGKIKEFGTHGELLKNGGLYKTMWDAQADYYR